MNEKRKRGFAALSPERRSEIAALGGKAVPSAKRSFSLNAELARDAGKKGGSGVPKEKRVFFKNPKAAADASRLGWEKARLEDQRTKKKD